MMARLVNFAAPAEKPADPTVVQAPPPWLVITVARLDVPPSRYAI